MDSDPEAAAYVDEVLATPTSPSSSGEGPASTPIPVVRRKTLKRVKLPLSQTHAPRRNPTRGARASHLKAGPDAYEFRGSSESEDSDRDRRNKRQAQPLPLEDSGPDQNDGDFELAAAGSEASSELSELSEVDDLSELGNEVSVERRGHQRRSSAEFTAWMNGSSAPKRRRLGSPARAPSSGVADQSSGESHGLVQRSPPYEGCVASMVSGKGDGICWESATSTSRCAPCKLGNHACRPCDPYVAPIARRLRKALDLEERPVSSPRSCSVNPVLTTIF